MRKLALAALVVFHSSILFACPSAEDIQALDGLKTCDDIPAHRELIDRLSKINDCSPHSVGKFRTRVDTIVAALTTSSQRYQEMAQAETTENGEKTMSVDAGRYLRQNLGSQHHHDHSHDLKLPADTPLPEIHRPAESVPDKDIPELQDTGSPVTGEGRKTRWNVLIKSAAASSAGTKDLDDNSGNDNDLDDVKPVPQFSKIDSQDCQRISVLYQTAASSIQIKALNRSNQIVNQSNPDPRLEGNQ